MDLKLLRYDYFLVVFILTCYHGHCLYEEDYDDAPSFGRCPWIRNKLKNGRVKLRSRGRIAKFLCDPGYELAGKRFATCVRGQWNNPIPVCVARGCSRKPAIRNGRITEMHRGAMLVYDCNPGYTLDGSVSIHCDGRRWSSDPPACVITTSEPETKCDFEDPDLCGWSHDPTHDFDWKRNQFATPSGHVGTGPSYDHTFGIGKGGFYLYLEASSPRKVNDTSRLFSPVYPQDLSEGCFIFWYHMYGATTGGLRVYLKPESHVFGELSPTWEKFGDQGNQWLRGHIPIPRLNENFQMVIEGIRGASYVGDSAIDDVQLTKSDCESMENATDTVADTVAESCRGRCREPDEESSCGCNENCVLNDTCCSDYATICTSGNDTSGENPDESLPVEELGKTSSLVTMTLTKSTVAENTEVETTSTTKIITTITTQEATKATTATISSSTSSPVPSTTQTSTSTAASTKLSTNLSELIYNTTIPPTFTSTAKSSTTQITSSSTKQTPQTTITNSSAKPISENNTVVMTSSTSKVLSTESPTSSTSVLTTTTAATTSSTTAAITSSTTAATISSTTVSTTAAVETTSVANTSPKVEVPIAVSTTSVKIEDISPSTSSTSSATSISSSSVSSTSITSTPSTRRTYNLRPRTQKTTPSTQQYSSSVSSTSSQVTITSSTVAQTTLSTSVTPLSIIEKLTSIPSSKAADATTLPSFTLRSSSTITSTSSTAPSSTSTTRTTSTTSRTSTTLSKMSTKIRYMIPTTNLVTVRIPRSTETVYQILTTPSSVSNHASKAASTANNGSQPTITIVSISVVAILCIAGGLAYYMKKQKAKRQSKLSDDSEMRFLPENEFMECSEGSAADILGKW